MGSWHIHTQNKLQIFLHKIKNVQLFMEHVLFYNFYKLKSFYFYLFVYLQRQLIHKCFNSPTKEMLTWRRSNSRPIRRYWRHFHSHLALFPCLSISVFPNLSVWDDHLSKHTQKSDQLQARCQSMVELYFGNKSRTETLGSRDRLNNCSIYD